LTKVPIVLYNMYLRIGIRSQVKETAVRQRSYWHVYLRVIWSTARGADARYTGRLWCESWL